MSLPMVVIPAVRRCGMEWGRVQALIAAAEAWKRRMNGWVYVLAVQWVSLTVGRE